MRVLIIGKGNMLANLIRGALLSKSEIVGVLRYENLYSSKLKLFLNDFFKSSAVLTLIKKHKLNDIKLKSANCEEFKKLMLKLNVDILLVGTWAEKLDTSVINLPRIASINVHPSLLPKYRGPNPYLQAIWHKEKFSGVTFHLMTDKLDAGPVLMQDKISISELDTGKELRNKTVFKARLLCSRLLSKLEKSPIEPLIQDESAASYFPDISSNDMTLDFQKETSDEIVAHVKAFYPFAPTYIQDGNTFWLINPYNVKLTSDTGEPGQIIKKNKNYLKISCKDCRCVEFYDLKKYNWLSKIGF